MFGPTRTLAPCLPHSVIGSTYSPSLSFPSCHCSPFPLWTNYILYIRSPTQLRIATHFFCSTPDLFIYPFRPNPELLHLSSHISYSIQTLNLVHLSLTRKPQISHSRSLLSYSTSYLGFSRSCSFSHTRTTPYAAFHLFLVGNPFVLI